MNVQWQDKHLEELLVFRRHVTVSLQGNGTVPPHFTLTLNISRKENTENLGSST